MKQPENIFRNSGIREIFGSKITTENNLISLGSAISDFFKSKETNILIGSDTRLSSIMIKKNLSQGIINKNGKVSDVGIIPTPAISVALQSNNFTCGLMITASHNPAEYNGIKVLLKSGYLTEDQEIKITKLFHIFKEKPARKINKEPQKIDIKKEYQNKIISKLKNIPFKNRSIVLDCANGATYKIAEKIFKAAGISVELINSSNDGAKINLNSGSTDPQLLLKNIKDRNIEWGCAFDGDGDRLIIVHQSGKIYDGDDILTILASSSRYKTQSIIVGTIMNNLANENYLKTLNKKLIRTNVGEKHIIEQLQKYKAELGAEPCGHITIMSHAPCSDGIFTALTFFDIFLNSKIKIPKKNPQISSTISLAQKILNENEINNLLAKNKILDGRIIARKSNTEPVLRLTVEHQNEKEAYKTLKIIKNKFLEILKER